MLSLLCPLYYSHNAMIRLWCIYITIKTTGVSSDESGRNGLGVVNTL